MSVTAVRAPGLVVITTARPAATITVSAAYPAARPATAGRTIRSRKPTASTYAQSGPGVSTSSTSIVRNVATRLAFMVERDYAGTIGRWLRIFHDYERSGVESCSWIALTARFLPSWRRTAGSR